MKLRLFIILITFVILLVSRSHAEIIKLTNDYTYKQNKTNVEILKDGKQVAIYDFNSIKPHFSIIKAPNGESVTEIILPNDPQNPEVAYRAAWTGLEGINGVNFWMEGIGCGKVRQYSLTFDGLGIGEWALNTNNTWTAFNGSRVFEEKRDIAFYSCKYGMVIAYISHINAGEKEVKFADTKNGFFAIKLAPGISLKGGKGRILNSNGEKDMNCAEKYARWCDYSGEINGKECGVAVFASSSNYGNPPFWNITEDGLMAANPFAQRVVKANDSSEPSLIIAPHKSKRFVFYILVHDKKLTKSELNDVADTLIGRPYTLPPDNRIIEINPGNNKTIK